MNLLPGLQGIKFIEVTLIEVHLSTLVASNGGSVKEEGIRIKYGMWSHQMPIT